MIKLHQIKVDGEGVKLVVGGRVRRSFRWSRIKAIEIRTTPFGPFLEDQFLVVRSRGHRRIKFPMTYVPGEVIGRIARLEGCDTDKLLESMSSTEHARFHLWPPKNFGAAHTDEDRSGSTAGVA